jgi:hypothetical protein
MRFVILAAVAAAAESVHCLLLVAGVVVVVEVHFRCNGVLFAVFVFLLCVCVCVCAWVSAWCAVPRVSVVVPVVPSGLSAVRS